MIKPEWGPAVRALARDAFWYACGRQDAGGIRVDVWAFAHHYGDLAYDATTYRPSIQDAYKEYADAND